MLAGSCVIRGRPNGSEYGTMNSTPAQTRVLLAALLLAAGAALAGCNTDSTGAPAAQAAPKEPLTHQQAALECWMATEHGHADMPLDKRADIVDACIKDKMAGKPVPAAALPKPKPKPKPAPNSTPGTTPKTQS